MQLFDVIVDVREWAADDKGDADADEVGEFGMDNSGGIEESIGDNGFSLNILSKKEKEKNNNNGKRKNMNRIKQMSVMSTQHFSIV